MPRVMSPSPKAKDGDFAQLIEALLTSHEQQENERNTGSVYWTLYSDKYFAPRRLQIINTEWRLLAVIQASNGKCASRLLFETDNLHELLATPSVIKRIAELSDSATKAALLSEKASLLTPTLSLTCMEVIGDKTTKECSLDVTQ